MVDLGVEGLLTGSLKERGWALKSGDGPPGASRVCPGGEQQLQLAELPAHSKEVFPCVVFTKPKDPVPQTEN